MCTVGMWRLFPVMVLTAGLATAAGAQEPQAPTREAAIEQAQAEKAKTLHPYVPEQGGEVSGHVETSLTSGQAALAPVLRERLRGRRLCARRRLPHHVSSLQHARRAGQLYDSGLQARRSEFIAPRLFNRRGELSVLGGWREATQVGFYGLGIGHVERRPHQLRVHSSPTSRRP